MDHQDFEILVSQHNDQFESHNAHEAYSLKNSDIQKIKVHISKPG